MRKPLIAVSALALALPVVLFVPPVRDWFFGNKMWPFPTPWDVTPKQVEELRAHSRPGDVIVERNLHSWHWMLLSKGFSGSSWVHAAIVDEDKSLISMAKTVKRQGFSTYLEKQSTDIKLVRPPYPNSTGIQKALQHARSKLGTAFDPDFENQAGNCTGLIATSLEAGDIDVPSRRAFLVGKKIYSSEDFFKMPGAKIVWSSKPSTDPSE